MDTTNHMFVELDKVAAIRKFKTSLSLCERKLKTALQVTEKDIRFFLRATSSSDTLQVESNVKSLEIHEKCIYNKIRYFEELESSL